MSGSIYNWSTTAASNGNSDGDINCAVGRPPSAVGPADRQVMGRVAEFIADQGGALVAGGSANVLTVTTNSAFTAHADGLMLALRITADNTAAATLNANGLGAKSIRKMVAAGEVALSGAELQQDGIFLFRYSSALNAAAGGWLLLNPAIDLTLFATLASPALTGNPTAPTPTAGDNDTSISTTAFVTGAISTAISALSSVYQAASAVLTALAGIGTAVAGDIIYATGAGTWGRRAKGSNGQVLALSSGLPVWGSVRTLGTAVASTSGTAIDFTGIPSWATQIDVVLAGVSTSGTSMLVLRLGTSGGIETTGYIGATTYAGSGAGSVGNNFSVGFNASGNIVASENTSGVLTLTLLDSSTNTWALGGSVGNGSVPYSAGAAGYTSLSGTLDRVRLTTANGTDTFDAGKVNISYS